MQMYILTYFYDLVCSSALLRRKCVFFPSPVGLDGQEERTKQRVLKAPKAEPKPKAKVKKAGLKKSSVKFAAIMQNCLPTSS